MWNASQHNSQCNFLYYGMIVQIQMIQDKILQNIEIIILEAYQQIIMSYQNNIAKESLSLQNHIVRPCFIFITQNTPMMHNPDDEPSNCFILQKSQTFSTFTQYMSETWTQHYRWNRMVVVEKTKRRRQSHINQAYQWVMEMPINRYQCE